MYNTVHSLGTSQSVLILFGLAEMFGNAILRVYCSSSSTFFLSIGVSNERLPNAHETWHAPRLAGSKSVQHATPKTRSASYEGKVVFK